MKVAFDLAEQPLADSIRTIGQKTGTNILFDPALTNGKMAQAIKGQFTAEEALARALANTDLTIQKIQDGTISITLREKADIRSEGAATAVDQRAVASSAMPRSDIYKSESIMVTAQKRTERLIDVPQSVTVISAEDLGKLGATQFRDYANTVPGLSFTTAGAGFTQISMRGVTIGVDIGPTVGVYVDEVPYGAAARFYSTRLALDSSLFDLERIEVLRGPQGTLYGASSMGGLIKYVSKRPDTTRSDGNAQVGFAGTQNGGVSFNVGAAVNVPLVTDKVALRASVFDSRDGGYIDNVARGAKDVNRSDIYGGRADLLFTPSGNLSVRITGFLQNIGRDGEGTVNYARSGGPLYGDLQQSRSFAEPFNQRFRLVSGTIDYDLEWARLTSISSYQTVRSLAVWDVSETYVPLLRSALGRSYSAVSVPNNYSTKKFVQEVRLADEGRSLEWVIGGFYTNETGSFGQQFVVLDPAGQPAPNDLLNTSNPLRYREYAAFGDLTFHLTSKFDVTGGLRYAHNNQDYTANGSGVFVRPRPTARLSQDAVTYLANARYHFSDRSIAYLRYATGYRPGAPNSSIIDPATGLPLSSLSFKPDELQSYEVGFKAETGDRRFGIDVAAYHNDWSNMQINVVRGGFGFIANSTSAATVRGGELVLTARPIAALTMTGSFAYTDARMSDADPDLRARAGERLPNVPRMTAALNADYAFAHGSLRPTIGATARYVSDRFSNFDANTSYPQHRFPPYATFDLRAGFTVGAVTAQLYIRNVSDKRGELSVSGGNVSGIPVAILQPRTIGVTATTHF